MSPLEVLPSVGLRARKKARTRASIQHEALRLFALQGYETTTVEQIAEAAEVSPSTLFRYFPSKEDLVFTDEYDEAILEAVRSQPPGLGAIEATRRAVASVFVHLGDEELEDMHQRAVLALSVPELRAAMIDQLAQSIHQITDLVAEQSGRPPDDFKVVTVAGAIVGVLIAAELHWAEHPGSNLVQLIDEALAHLEAGLPY